MRTLSRIRRLEEIQHEDIKPHTKTWGNSAWLLRTFSLIQRLEEIQHDFWGLQASYEDLRKFSMTSEDIKPHTTTWRQFSIISDDIKPHTKTWGNSAWFLRTSSALQRHGGNLRLVFLFDAPRLYSCTEKIMIMGNTKYWDTARTLERSQRSKEDDVRRVMFVVNNSDNTTGVTRLLSLGHRFCDVVMSSVKYSTSCL